MQLGVKDKRVIKAFISHEHATGHKLSTDGVRLDGHWMGGSNIAEWLDGSIAFHDLGSRAAQTVQRAVQRAAKLKHQNPTFWIQKALKHHKKGSLHRQLHVPMGQKIPAGKLEAASHAPGKLGRRARLAKTLRRLGARR